MLLKLEATLLVSGVHKHLTFSTELRGVEEVGSKLSLLSDALLEATVQYDTISESTVEDAPTMLADTVKVSEPAKEVETPKVEESKKVEEPKIETPKQGELPIQEKKPLDKAMEAVDKKLAESEKTATKAKKSKNTPYDRKNDVHKARISEFMDLDDKSHPGRPSWRTDGVLPKAVVASERMNGLDFIDPQGNVLETFKTAFIKLVRD